MGETFLTAPYFPVLSSKLFSNKITIIAKNCESITNQSVPSSVVKLLIFSTIKNSALLNNAAEKHHSLWIVHVCQQDRFPSQGIQGMITVKAYYV